MIDGPGLEVASGADCLSVGQIYPPDDLLLREPLLPDHPKPRLLGLCT